MARYRFDRETMELVEIPPRDYSQPLGLMIQRDLPAYQSPLGNYMVDGRRARREDLARNGCREVEPSEFKPQWRSKAEKAKIAETQRTSRAAYARDQAAVAAGITNIKE